MKIKEIKSNIDLELIKEELKTLPPYDTQICLQGIEGSDDPFLGCGISGEKNSWERIPGKLTYPSSDFKYPLFSSMPYMNNLMETYEITNTRIMILRPKTCYSYHRDISKRLHIPVETNEDCFFIIEKEVFYLPNNGNHFIVDTTLFHTAINASQYDRLHIVGRL